MLREPEGKPKGETRHEEEAAKTASGGHGRAKAKRKRTSGRMKEGHGGEKPECPKKELSLNRLYRFQDSERKPEGRGISRAP